MCRLLKVTGNSLYPRYREGDFVMVSKIPSLFGWLKPGDVVVFNHPDHGIMIKMIDRLDHQRREYFVVGLDEHSVDSRRFGPVPGAAVVGKVIWHIKKPMA